jgi:hypothetical protein
MHKRVGLLCLEYASQVRLKAKRTAIEEPVVGPAQPDHAVGMAAAA